MKNEWYMLWRCILANLLYYSAKEKTRRAINSDIDRYLEHEKVDANNKKRSAQLDYLLLSGEPSFRSVFYYRLKARKISCAICRIFLPSIKEIEIYGKIDGGLYLSHNYMVVHPHSAGNNLRVDAGVVIGVNNGQFPTIGNNVCVGANSTVIGGINIGDNVIIEPGSVVTKSLESNAVYGGNPAVFIRNINVQEEA